MGEMIAERAERVMAATQNLARGTPRWSPAAMRGLSGWGWEPC